MGSKCLPMEQRQKAWPRMGPISSTAGEIMQVAIPIDVQKISPMAVREYADWVLRPG